MKEERRVVAGKSTHELTALKERAAREIVAGHWKDALKALQEVIELAPKDTHAAMKIGDMYQRIGKKQEAIAAYKKAATLFAAAGFLIKAISVNKIILSLDPQERQVQNSLAALYSKPETGVPALPIESLPLADDSLDIDLARVDKQQLPRTALFSDLTAAELDRVMDKLVPVFAAAQTLICREGENAESMYIIAHGLVRVSCKDSSGSPLWLTNLAEGEFFGEFGLLGDGFRHADVLAAEDTELLAIGKAEIDDLIREFPRIKQVLFGFYKERVIDTLLAKSPVFRCLSQIERKELVELAALQEHQAGERLLEEGKPGEHLFLVKSGEVEVYTGLADKRIDLAMLSSGDLFGEISSLTGNEVTANVGCKTKVELVRFSREVMMAMVERNSQLRYIVSELWQHRIRDTINKIQLEGFV